MSSYDYLSVGRTAMAAFRLGMNIAGYNVANANTPGYSRREMTIGPLLPVAVRNGLMGSGVDVLSVKRVRDPFVDTAGRDAMGHLGFDKGMNGILAGLEPVMGTTETPAVTNALSSLFDGFESLVSQPDSPAVRADVVARAADLASTIRRTDASLADAQRFADSKIVDSVNRINTIVGQLRQMNVDIVQQEANGTQAADLRDQRDTLLDELSGLANVRTVEQENGQISVFLGTSGDPLLTTVTARKLTMTQGTDGLTNVQVDRGGQLVNVTESVGGALGGLLHARDRDIAGYRATLDQLATTVIDEFNAVQKAGYDQSGNAGQALFVPDPPAAHAAEAIQLNPALAQDPKLLATSSAPNESGNNANAQAFTALRDKAMGALGGRTLVDYSSDLISTLGRDIRTSDAAVQAGQTIVDSFGERRNQVSGVSLDEEASNLVKWQQSFEAAARFLKMSNDMVEQALNALSSMT